MSSTLVIYAAMDLGATRIALGVALVRAAPQLAGLLRLAAPAVIGRLASRKTFCMACYLASAVVLLALPAAARPGAIARANVGLAVLVGLWCVYHLLEYLGSVALWSWLADLVPPRIRGRFLGRRERWLVGGQAAGYAVCGLFSYLWRGHHPPEQAWTGYAVPALAGAVLMMAAVAPLARMPAALPPAQRPDPLGPALLAPLADRGFRRLLAFGCWFSFFNGLTLPAQDMYPIEVLKVALLVTLGLSLGLRAGQMLVGPWLGQAADRWGNRPVIAASLLVVATGPLFYLAATPQRPWLMAGASVAWIAYAGINIALPNLMLRLSPAGNNAAHIAVYQTAGGLCLAAATIAGALIAQRLRGMALPLWSGGPTLGYYQAAFLASWVLRSLGVLVLLAVPEPGRSEHDRRQAPTPPTRWIGEGSREQRPYKT